MQNAFRDSNGNRRLVPGWLKSPFGARSSLVITVVAVLALVAGSIVVLQITDQMRHEADDRLAAASAMSPWTDAEVFADASSDIRLARQNVVFEDALADSPGPLVPSDQAAVESAITYLGERYEVDEICVIRSSGLEAARWVGGSGVAPLDQLSPDERPNNPAVLPTLQLDDDAFFQSQPYVSPDSGRWVIGIATPVVLPSGGTEAKRSIGTTIAPWARTFGAGGQPIRGWRCVAWPRS